MGRSAAAMADGWGQSSLLAMTASLPHKEPRSRDLQAAPWRARRGAHLPLDDAMFMRISRLLTDLPEPKKPQPDTAAALQEASA